MRTIPLDVSIPSTNEEQVDLLTLVQSLSNWLSQASDEAEILSALAKYFSSKGASSAKLTYFQLDDSGLTLSVEDVATWVSGEITSTQLSWENTYKLDTSPLAALWSRAFDAVVFVNDVAQEPELGNVDAVKQSIGTAVVIVPVKVHGKLQALVTIGWAETHAFTDDEQQVYTSLVPVLVATISNRRSYLASEALRRRYEIIANINAALGQASDEQQILTAVGALIKEYGVTLSTLSFATHDEKGEVVALDVMAWQYMGNPMPLEHLPGGTRYPRGTSPLNELILSVPDPLFIEDMFTDPRTETGPTREAAKVTSITSMIALPLRNNNRSLGAFFFSWPTPRIFPAELREILKIITPTATAVVANRRLLAQTEMLYKISEERLGAVIGNAPIILFALDEQGKFTLSEGRGLETFNLRPNELVGRSAFDVYYDNAAMMADIRRALKGDSFDSTVQNGKLTYQTWYSPIRNQENAVTGVIGVSMDVTNLKRAERERERLIKELEEALLFKDQFLATMSHELRTPLNAVQGYSGIALMNDDIPDNVREMLERIKVNAKRLLNLINDILDISRINANRIEILARPVKLIEVAQGWHRDLKQEASDKGIELGLTLDPALPSTIISDEERLTQIVNNLLGNALKFTEKGMVDLRIYLKDDSVWVIEVADTGIGIPETWQHLIFEEFRQVDGSSRRKHGGAGLGLSIVQKLCILMGGSVTVTSKLGEGSTFTVTLPLRIPELA
jgi:PAS domain S-box-containing protein